MTDFLRNILATAAAANAAAAASDTPQKRAGPVDQIQIPPSAALVSAAEKLVKVEPTDAADAGKAQRAARRDVVNARRDKRKAMAQHASPASPLGLTSGADSSTDSEDEIDDKSKKMKTSATSSVAVAGGLGASETKKPSFSSTMPPTPGLLFTPEIDAAGEERLRAMEAQLETLDPDSKEAKKKRRLIRNRMSAQLHRERKKAYVGQLEDQLLEKDRELKALQEKLAKLMAESEKPAAPVVETTKTIAVAAPPASKPKDDEVFIKEEPQNWDAPTWALDAADSWDLHGLEDSEMAEIETADLLRDFDDPFAGLGGAEYPELKPHHEIHAAKKNIAMMAAVMFSVSFFGNSPAFYNVTPGSNFSSTFGPNPPKDLSQMSIASRIVACLEKTTWKEFRTVSSWISARAAADKEAAEQEEAKQEEDETPARAVASPSAASDVTDSPGSPAQSVLDDMGETDLIDEFEYPVEDPFGAAAGGDWLDDVEKDLPKQADAEYFLSDAMLNEPVVPKQADLQKASLTSRLYESLTALWREKNQVLLTVRNDKQQVLQRSVADMSTIREGLQSGNFFTKVLGGDAADAAASEDQSVTFLYPLSAFAPETKPSTTRADAEDPVFLEVSCQMNGGAVAAMM